MKLGLGGLAVGDLQMTSFGSLKSAIFDKEAKKQRYQDHIRGLNAYDRHKKFLHDYAGFYGGDKFNPDKLPIKTDQDTLREGYRFIRSEEDDMHPSWEQRLVKRYYDKLFKEYCIADMSQYKTGKIGLRWRTEKEVVSGKGQFVCGNKHCSEKECLASYEVNFSYYEAGENKQALVKLVACERCAKKLLYRKLKGKEQLKIKEQDAKRKREREESEDDTSEDRARTKGKKTSTSLDDGKTDEESEDDTSEDRARTKGKKTSTSLDDAKTDEEENFDEFLQGMFP